MKNTSHYIILIILALLSFAVQAQRDIEEEDVELPKEAREKLEAAKIAFITKDLNLSTEEAQKFWPLHNAYEAERKAIRKELRGIRRRSDTESDSELEKSIKRSFALKREEIDLEERYHAKFKEVISIRQLAKLRKSEHKFKKLMLDNLRSRRREKQGG